VLRKAASLQAFKARQDTFSLGVCNGCQLMALLGWVNPKVRKSVDSAMRHSAHGNLRGSPVRRRRTCGCPLRGRPTLAWLGASAPLGRGRSFQRPTGAASALSLAVAHRARLSMHGRSLVRAQTLSRFCC
jgi:hypothetical protein